MIQKTTVIRGGTLDPVGCRNNLNTIFGPTQPATPES